MVVKRWQKHQVAVNIALMVGISLLFEVFKFIVSVSYLACTSFKTFLAQSVYICASVTIYLLLLV